MASMQRKFQRAYVRKALAELYEQYRMYRAVQEIVGKPAKTLRQWLKLDPE